MTENKGDLISREALKKSFEETVCIEPMPYAFVKQIIDNAPTAEAYTEDDTPAGKWIPEEKTFTDLSGAIETYTRFKCDRCLQGQNFGPYPFCPWCGKKMNPEIREETTI